MALFGQLAATIWRDYVTDYVSSSGLWNPKKSDIRGWHATAEQLFESITTSGGLLFASKASMDADLAHAANTPALVIGDATAANNGLYYKSGASGSGSWVRLSDVPGHPVILANNAGAGTANAIEATTSIGVPSTDGAALIMLPIVATNTTTSVTVSFDGGAILAIKTNSGNDPATGGLIAGMIVAGYKSGSDFRLLSDQASAAIVSQCETYANQAAASAASAAGVSEATSLTAIRGVDTSSKTAAYLNLAPRRGLFVWDASDLSSILLGSAITSSTISGNTITSAAHRLLTGEAVITTSSVNGLSTNTIYYVINVDGDNFKLASSFANAFAGTAVVLSGTTATTIKRHSDPLQGMFITPTADITGASGAWRRESYDFLTPQFFNAAGDGTTDDFQKWFSAVRYIAAVTDKPKLFGPAASYRFAKQSSTNPSLWLASGTTIEMDPNAQILTEGSATQVYGYAGPVFGSENLANGQTSDTLTGVSISGGQVLKNGASFDGNTPYAFYGVDRLRLDRIACMGVVGSANIQISHCSNSKIEKPVVREYAGYSGATSYNDGIRVGSGCTNTEVNFGDIKSGDNALAVNNEPAENLNTYAGADITYLRVTGGRYYSRNNQALLLYIAGTPSFASDMTSGQIIEPLFRGIEFQSDGSGASNDLITMTKESSNVNCKILLPHMTGCKLDGANIGNNNVSMYDVDGGFFLDNESFSPFNSHVYCNNSTGVEIRQKMDGSRNSSTAVNFVNGSSSGRVRGGEISNCATGVTADGAATTGTVVDGVKKTTVTTWFSETGGASGGSVRNCPDFNYSGWTVVTSSPSNPQSIAAEPYDREFSLNGGSPTGINVGGTQISSAGGSFLLRAGDAATIYGTGYILLQQIL